MAEQPMIAGADTQPTEDAAIIARSLAEPDRFAELYDRYVPLLYGYVHRRVGRQVAEDVVADTFLAAFRARAQYDTQRPDARPWLFAIATRELARHHRREKARYRALLNVKHEPGEPDLAEQVASAATAQAHRTALLQALAHLSRRDRDVLLLIAWAGLSYEEVAQALDIPIGTVRSRLNRARHQTRAALGDRHPDAR